MKKNIQYRLALIAAIAIGFGVSFWYYQVRLGLDLQGGIHLVLQVQTKDALEAEASQVRDRLESRFKESNVTFGQLLVLPDNRIQIDGVPVAQRADAEREMENWAVNWTPRSNAAEGKVGYTLELSSAARVALLKTTVDQAKEIIDKRVNTYGVAEPNIVIYGSGEVADQIIVELPGVEDFDRITRILQRTATLDMRLVHPDHPETFPTREDALRVFGNQLPPEFEILPFLDRDDSGRKGSFMVVRKAAALTGQQLKDARLAEDPFTGRFEVKFSLNAEGVRLFSDVTGKNVGKYLAIVLDGEIRSAPVIESQINSEDARITGHFNREQAEDLALVLRSGALPAPIRILENRSVGPSLGRDSIRSGVAASALGLILVVLGMFVFYRWSGANAVLCLALNLLILVGLLASMGATLTLPGIAGVILTIGMAVDANILIFERIKEELRLGKTVRSAVQAGFERVFSTIMDTNLTTLVASLLLGVFGTGPVKGFAVTLAAGLVANVFTATFVSRTIFNFFLQNREVSRLSI